MPRDADALFITTLLDSLPLLWAIFVKNVSDDSGSFPHSSCSYSNTMSTPYCPIAARPIVENMDKEPEVTAVVTIYGTLIL